MNKKVLVPAIVILIGVLITQLTALIVRETNNLTLNYLAFFTILIQWIAFLHAGGFVFGNEKTEKYYDLIGCVTFISTLILSLHNSGINNLTSRQLILAFCVGFWSLRLGLFLFIRIHRNNGVDSRFTDIKRNNFRFLMTWTLQGIWVFLTLLPVLIINQQRKSDHGSTALDLLGYSLWILGFTIESLADYQKFSFRSTPANKEKFINSGLWKHTRHPNYFGEIVLWFGLSLSAYSGTKSLSVFISPIFVAFLLIYVSGLPSLEKKADLVYGNDEKYQFYKANTPVLIPFVGRKGSAKF